VSWYRDTMLLEPDNSLYFRSKGSLHTMTIRHPSTSHTIGLPDVLVREGNTMPAGQAPVYNIHKGLYTFSRLFVLNVHKVGHPQKRFIYRLLTRHDCLPVWLVADK
jgi:hypothetical protein